MEQLLAVLTRRRAGVVDEPARAAVRARELSAQDLLRRVARPRTALWRGREGVEGVEQGAGERALERFDDAWREARRNRVK